MMSILKTSGTTCHEASSEYSHFFWFVLNDSNLSKAALSAIANPANDILISPASYWEALKVSIGKYQIPAPFQRWMEHHITVNVFEILPIAIAHSAIVSVLPFHHKDPFDRLLIAQALAEQIPTIRADRVLEVIGDATSMTIFSIAHKTPALDSFISDDELWRGAIDFVIAARIAPQFPLKYFFHPS